MNTRLSFYVGTFASVFFASFGCGGGSDAPDPLVKDWSGMAGGADVTVQITGVRSDGSIEGSLNTRTAAGVACINYSKIIGARDPKNGTFYISGNSDLTDAFISDATLKNDQIVGTFEQSGLSASCTVAKTAIVLK